VVISVGAMVLVAFLDGTLISLSGELVSVLFIGLLVLSLLLDVEVAGKKIVIGTAVEGFKA
jgi:hypothetical protein